MKKLIIPALALLVLLSALCGCDRQELHSYSDPAAAAYDKFSIDLSDDTRFPEGEDISITEAGVFHIFGHAEKKSIIIKAHPNAQILLSLEGVSLSGSTGSVLRIERAGSVGIILADGSKNVLSSGSGNRGGAAVLYSRAPVTVEGDGSLELLSENGIGMEAGGDILLLGGELSVCSASDALTARGSVTIGGGTLRIDTDADAVKASGTLKMTGGELFADAGGSGIGADEISFSAGRCDIACSRFIFNTENDISIEGGEHFLSSYNADGEYGVVSTGSRIAHTGGQLILLSDGAAPIANQTLHSAVITLTDDAEGGIISVKDKNGTEAVKSERSRLPVRCVSIAAPSIVQGEKYTVSIGEIKTKLVQSELVSQKTVSTEPSKMTEHEYNGIRYLLYTPAYVSEELPMVVFLHGSGEKGEDLGILTLAPSLPKFLQDRTLEIDAYVMIPQLPKAEDGWYKIAAGLEGLIEHSRETLPVIKDKVSLTGHSLGGGGVWMLALRHTERYSRIAPLSGWVDLNETNLNKLSRIPVWDLVGELDTAVPPEESKPMTDALKAIGADVRSTVFLGAKHHEVPTLAYLSAELGLWEWLLS